MVKVEWDTNIYKKFSELYSIRLFEKSVITTGFSRTDTLLFPISAPLGIEILESVDQILNIKTGHTMLMSKVVMEVPEELDAVYDLKRI